VKREVALAIVVGAAAGLLGAFTNSLSPRGEDGQGEGSPPVEPAERDRLLQPSLGPTVVHENPRQALLRVQVTPPQATALRLARWSLRAGKGSDGEWLAQPPASTSAEGRAELMLPPGTYFIGAGAAWTQAELFTVTDVELQLEVGQPLSGRVLEAGTDRPVANALVVASPGKDAPEAEKHAAQTDGLGRFAFAELPRGELALEVSAPGFARSTAEASAPGTADVRIEKSCRVDGVVVDAPHASVSGTREGDPATLAGEDGRFWLDLDCGGATLVARDAAGRIGLAKVAFGQKTVTLRLGEGLWLKGTVRTRDGAAVTGADVAAMLGDDDVRARAVSDERGTFSLGPLLAGPYTVRARKGRGTSGAVFGAEAPGPADVVVEPGASLEAEVSGADDPITVEVTWSSLRNEKAARARSMGGKVRFEDLPAGAATVIATVGGRSAERRVFLASGTAQTVQLQLEPHGRIVGRVTGPNGAGAKVVAWRHLREQELSRITHAGPDGAYAVEVPAGDYRVGASNRGSHVLRFDVSVPVVAGRDSRLDLELSADAGEGWGPMASVARGETGASYENVNGSVQVSWVVADSPMSAAGLKVGDVVTAIDGKPVTNALDAFSRTRGDPGAKVAITWRRDGVERTSVLALAP